MSSSGDSDTPVDAGSDTGPGDPPTAETLHHPSRGPKKSAVNDQIADAIAMSDAQTVAGAQIVSQAGITQIAAQSVALAMLNAVHIQHQSHIAAEAAVMAAVRGIAGAVAEKRNG